MKPSYVIFFATASLLFMVTVSSSTNFVSAETKCYTSGEKYICISTFDVEPPNTVVTICDAGTNDNCTHHWLDKVSTVTPEVETLINNAQVAQLDNQETTKDSKDVGGVNSNIPSGTPEIKKLP